ncbi:rcc01693 family protein [Rhodopseudomonas palustris]|uniref:rcc01693 family protein n=1 Tax=Rhodopseudomonas palustris TaxID=1076 RepID=UPI0006422797|nr:rcc01693 family protein [Rhodopseudomonas palustris]
MTPFPWAEAMQLGLGVLRLPPDQFWRMTPRELASALIGARGDVAAPLDRGGLAELMRRYPDHKEQAR